LQNKSISLFGDPSMTLSAIQKGFNSLPGTLEEVMTIQKLLGAGSWETKIFIKSGASESTIRKTFSKGILHIASHGFFSADVIETKDTDKDFLFHSGIVLAGNATEKSDNDGILTAFEVMNLNLNNMDLIVLSACETGLGKIETSEGVYGLQRSFLQAGASNVILSLWKVDDTATKDLMIEFYKNLLDGKSVRASLKQAQLHQMQKLSDPFSWGAFTLVSNQ
jgi:CHAT domain-containing protein